jgi:hypothetical protein
MELCTQTVLAAFAMEPKRIRWCSRAVRVRSSLAVVTLVLILVGCGDSQGEESRSATSTLEAGADNGESIEGSKASTACGVTIPARSGKPAAVSGPDAFNFGSTDLRAALYWPQGRLTAGVLPDGGTMATINVDGSITVKVGWWRGVPGELVISGHRLDGEAPPLRADVPEGYGPRGFQPTGLTFPTTGCWRVVGNVGDAELTFVVRVSKIAT